MSSIIKSKKRALLTLCLGAFALLVSGCVKQQTIYYWDDYQSVLYDYYQQDQSSPQEQISELERIIEQAKSADKPTPPGLHAQLGLLYANIGSQDKALEHFEIEKIQFPESAVFIQFIQNKYQGNAK